jgi:hypothetical protein
MEPKKTLVNGKPVSPDHREINPQTGQQKDYVVLAEEERAKGFVRPLRCSYIHRGIVSPEGLRDLTGDEKAKYANFNYVKYQAYPSSANPVVGRFWTQEQLDRHGCNSITTMSLPIAETYARQPTFYGATFCTGCHKHLPLNEFYWLDPKTNQPTGEQLGT